MYRSIVLGFAILLGGVPALSQTETSREPRRFSFERFRPSMDGEGMLDVEWAQTKDFLAWDLALWLNYANDPFVLVIREDDGTERDGPALVKHRLGGNLVGAVGLFPWLQIGLDLPMILYQSRADSLTDVVANPAGLSTAGTGDLRVRPKLQLLRSEDQIVDLALIATVTLPTASATAYMGEKTVGFEPELVVSKPFAELRAAFNIGYRLRQRTESVNLVVDDEVHYRLGLAYPLMPRFSLPLEASASLAGAFAAGAPFEKANQTPLEALFGGAYDAYERVRVFGAFGLGLRPGFGTPDYRVILGVRLHTPAERDRDRDGLADSEDACPDDPEDHDAFQDEDGCPDPDNDGDGVLDVDDGAPNDPEDADGFEDADGVPDPDNDGDGLLDDDDKCPNEAGPAENTGCPEVDSDGDGIVDRLDQCVQEPEDKDGFKDADGCPDPDNDGDGLPDGQDRCPDAPGPAETAGCPDPDRDGDGVVDRVDNCPDEPGVAEHAGCKAPQKVRLTGDRIEILEKVHFDTGKATILEKSFSLLDDVARVLEEHPEIQRVRVEGHTDDRGSDSFNKDLSQRRAESVVEYLKKKGIAAERLEAVGFGEERPVASNKTSRGRASNRRVEFNIVGQQEEQAPPPSEQ